MVTKLNRRANMVFDNHVLRAATFERGLLTSVAMSVGWLTLCRLTVVGFHDASEFTSAANAPFGLWNEVLVQDRVVSTDAPMWSLVMIMPEPDTKDVVELIEAKAHKVIP